MFAKNKERDVILAWILRCARSGKEFVVNVRKERIGSVSMYGDAASLSPSREWQAVDGC